MSHSYVQMHNFLNEIQKHQNYDNPVVGDLKWSIRSADFKGWLLCDGRSVDKTKYPELYQLITNKFGSETLETFTLPDAHNRILGAIGSQRTQNGVVSPAKNLGQLVGTETHILTEGEMPSHNHTITDPGHNHSVSINAHGLIGDGGPTDNFNNGGTMSTSNMTTGITINNTGSGLAHNNMQPTLFIGNVFIFCGNFYDGL